MILVILTVVLPVFLVIGAGYLATRTGVFAQSGVDGLMTFTQNFAIPCLLFRALVDLDLGRAFDPGLLVAFYAGAVSTFVLGILGARRIFGRRPGEAVAIGFGALFSNSVLLGLPIMERAYGAAALDSNYAIISIHAPVCYLLGITAMEFARADGRGPFGTLGAVTTAMFRNALMIGLALGFAVNLGDITVPGTVRGAVDLMATAALPAALFGLGGVLTRYRLRASLAEAGLTAGLSLVVHPMITMGLALLLALPVEFVRSAVVTAAMAPGVNTYIFASMYSRGQAQAASAVLIGTALSVLTASAWLAWLGGVQ